jgi:hypothetical protein
MKTGYYWELVSKGQKILEDAIPLFYKEWILFYYPKIKMS